MPCTTTFTTPLANGVTADKLVKILHHHRTLIDLIAPRHTKLHLDTGSETSTESNTSRNSSKSSQSQPIPPQLARFSSKTSTSSTRVLDENEAEEKRNPSTASDRQRRVEGPVQGPVPTQTTVYSVSEPTFLGYHSYPLEITGWFDGVETKMSPCGKATIHVRWRVKEEMLIEEVKIVGGWCWNRSQAKRRALTDSPRRHQALMQLAATSKSMTGSYSDNPE